MKYAGIIKGNTPSKSNCYRIGRAGNRCMMYKGKDLKCYEESFQSQLPQDMRGLMISTDFMLAVDVYYPTLKSDLDNSLKVILDCLQSAGVIKNDNKCLRIEANKFKDKENPRIEFELTVL